MGKRRTFSPQFYTFAVFPKRRGGTPKAKERAFAEIESQAHQKGVVSPF